jgi:hypothetical protein
MSVGAPGLDELIVYWFEPTVTPVGGAPLRIRESWVGVPLPVRRPRPVEGPEPHVGRDVSDTTVRRHVPDGVTVAVQDAIAALEYFERGEAASWWRGFAANRPASRTLLFRRWEGNLLPPRLALMLHPELEDLRFGAEE